MADPRTREGYTRMTQEDIVLLEGDKLRSSDVTMIGV